MAPTKLIATYRVTTPMFSAGADPDVTAELRPASFKGVLRFWFRALSWGRYGDIEALRRAEDELFGSTRGQAKVLLSLRTLGEKRALAQRSKLDLGRGYLAGQGLATAAAAPATGALTKRPAIQSGTRFEVSLLLKTPGHETSLREALIAMGLLGGLGSRSRRGFGSIALETLTPDGPPPWTAPIDLEALKSRLQSILRVGAKVKAEPPYTALSASSRIVVVQGAAGESVEALHERVGKAFLFFRSFGQKRGQDHFVGETRARPRFKADHDLMLRVASRAVDGRERVPAPRRAAFGLPHNYFFSSGGGLKANVNGIDAERRASPLLFHAHGLGDGRPVVVLSFLPATFLPDARPELALGIGKRTITRTPVPSSPALWEPIHEFLDEVLRGEQSELMSKFPDVVEVTR